MCVQQHLLHFSFYSYYFKIASSNISNKRFIFYSIIISFNIVEKYNLSEIDNYQNLPTTFSNSVSSKPLENTARSTPMAQMTSLRNGWLVGQRDSGKDRGSLQKGGGGARRMMLEKSKDERRWSE